MKKLLIVFALVLSGMILGLVLFQHSLKKSIENARNIDIAFEHVRSIGPHFSWVLAPIFKTDKGQEAIDSCAEMSDSMVFLSSGYGLSRFEPFSSELTFDQHHILLAIVGSAAGQRYLAGCLISPNMRGLQVRIIETL